MIDGEPGDGEEGVPRRKPIRLCMPGVDGGSMFWQRDRSVSACLGRESGKPAYGALLADGEACTELWQADDGS